MNPLEIIKAHKEEIKAKYEVKRIGIFGSYVRGEQKGDSDIALKKNSFWYAKSEISMFRK